MANCRDDRIASPVVVRMRAALRGMVEDNHEF